MPEEAREAVIEAVAEALGDAYDCTRVWGAWSYGTMGPDDFVSVAGQADRLAEIADSAIAAYTRSLSSPAPVGAEPVAWGIFTDDGKPVAHPYTSRELADEYNGRELEGLGMVVRPLFLGAPAPAPAEENP